MELLEKLKGEYRLGFEKAFGGQTLALYYIDEIARILVYGCDEREILMQKCATLALDTFMRRGDGEGCGRADEALASVGEAGRCASIAYFCKAIAAFLKEKGEPLTENELLQSAVSEETELGSTVAYVRNAVSDEAFLRFTGAIKDASVSYTASFAAACEEVYYGRVRYCILPYETSEDGTLSGFMKMMRKYELYPKCICSVRGERTSTKFVLLSRQPSEVIEVNGAKRYLRVTVDSPNPRTFVGMCVASEALGLKLVKNESVPVSWDEGRYGSVFTFDVSEAETEPFLLYLMLSVPECSERSVYVEI